MSDLQKLKLLAKNFTILYAEDNNALRLNATKLLEKFFDMVDAKPNGLDALDSFKEHKHHLVITDIKMPKMDGLTLAKKIKEISPQTKVIIMSAFDEKEYLFDAIEVGVFRFLKKPVNITKLTEVLLEAILEIKNDLHAQLFHSHLQSVFNYQSSMVVMIKENKSILANQTFLDFFHLKSIEDCAEIGKRFLPHDGFLYNHDEIEWFDVIEVNQKKLFHVKMKNHEGKIRHLILKYQIIPERSSYGLLSFDDITELNLLKLFDEKEQKNDIKSQDSKAIFDLLEVIQRNSAKIEVHNYYKGLSITNDALITDIDDISITIKTSYLQEKAVQFEKKTLLVSEAFPYAIECSKVVKMSFETQSIMLKELHFVQTSPIIRKTIRVVPDEKQSASLFLGENKFHGDVTILDISLDAVKLSLNALPAGLEKESEVNLDLVLELDKRPLIINTKATMLRKSESKHRFCVVFLFKDIKKKELVKYITKRQMAIIREFKGLQNG